MAKVGEQLKQPEAGWKRYDDSDGAINYIGDWPKSKGTGYYKGSLAYSPPKSSWKILFSFRGTKIRIIASPYSDRATNHRITIDGETKIYSERISPAVEQALVYEKTGLAQETHFVEIEVGTDGSMTIDAIDIDDNGQLLHPDEVNSFGKLEIGKKIRCHYKAISNTLGIFSGIGNETSGFISPTSSSSTPDGDFYFICVDKDYLGRWKLIADRNIQHSISWDTLNSAGVANGSGLPIELNYENIAKNKHVEADTNHFQTFSVSKVVDGIDIHTDGFLQANEDIGKITRIIIDLGKEEEIDGLALTNLLYTSGYRCKNFGFSWSNDKKNWNFIMNAVLPNNEIKHFFKIKARARYFSILIKDSYLSSGWSLGIGEIELIKTNRQMKTILRLLTGGTGPDDEDNEWNKYIVNDTLNGLITPGDDNVWNWKSDTPSWTSTTQTIASRRVRRGGGSGGLRGYYSDTTTLSESNVSGTASGFRPVLVLTHPPTSSLIYHDDKYKTHINGWKTISTTLPSKDTFMSDGMRDLSVLDRKEQIVSLPMTSCALGEGRVFKAKIDYNKYFDINRINVK